LVEQYQPGKADATTNAIRTATKEVLETMQTSKADATTDAIRAATKEMLETMQTALAKKSFCIIYLFNMTPMRT